MRVPAERMAEFEAAYRATLLPLLKQYGVVEAAQRGHKTVEGVFSMDVSDCIFCNTEIKVTGCRACHTLYTWATYKGGKYKYLVPLTDRAVLKDCKDMTGL